MKIQKYIALAGICSRREAEKLIQAKKITINKKIAETADRINPEEDEIIYKGKILKPAKKIYLALNKPYGYTCTSATFKKEKNIFELIDLKEKLSIFGRLDKDSSGLVILSNDGEFGLKITHPRYKHEKEYLVALRERISYEDIKKLKFGVDIGSGDSIVKAKSVIIIKEKLIKIILTSGKKRQIKRMVKTLGNLVIKIHRVRMANIKIENLKTGKWRHLKNKEIQSLKSAPPAKK